MHQTTEYNMDAMTLSLYTYYEGVWTKHMAINYRRLRFEITGIASEEPRCITHKAEGVQWLGQIDLTDVHAVEDGDPEGLNDPSNSIYTSEIEECFHVVPKHIRRLVGNIPELNLPEDFDCTEPTDLIVAPNGAVLFGVAYHSWLVSTKTEHIILRGGGPDDGSPLYMTTYQLELGAIRAGLMAIGVLSQF
jgi:hypothetical protein